MARNTGTGSTPLRSFRSPDALWDAAIAKAAAGGPTISDVLNRALSEFTGVPVPSSAAAPAPAPAKAPRRRSSKAATR